MWNSQVLVLGSRWERGGGERGRKGGFQVSDLSKWQYCVHLASVMGPRKRDVGLDSVKAAVN